ncbi:MAG: hypothetical protein A3H70_01965 [Candidatus Komeilibacteria bacterium RIFCSPLOWO2_02_FULL_48_11]|uniref:DUF218 domain-containing protein n=1 Tax=Candidatus Komeilibacteria bacterium RIFCSPLOWO2_02_FULL_48_11 TaxID=1798553 RepID=A0A1G2BSY8_9BACT|nr:MAG: hypothetical protein A3H70_01965 [Candidatus Komeilibacteria bacterium RIFCSPLOWO2_02_FULL_48_11]
MNSARLPGKVLKPLAGKPVLWHVWQRCSRSRLARNIIVATSKERSDDAIATFCRKNKISFFRGDLDNVLKRFYACAAEHTLDVIVRITADCPLIDPFIIDELIKFFKESRADYASNCLRRVFPRGLDCEVFSFALLRQAYQKAKSAREKEHVTPYMIKHGDTAAYTVPKSYQGHWRLTLDDEADYLFLRRIYDKFYGGSGIIDVKQVIKYLKNNPNLNQNSAVIILGGGLAKDKNGRWRSTKYNDQNARPKAYGDYLRVVAASYLYRHNPNWVIALGGHGHLKGAPQAVTLAGVIKQELKKLGVKSSDIIVEGQSGSTFEQLRALARIAKNKNFKKVIIISNAYHLPRVKAMVENFKELGKAFTGINLNYVSAEKIVLKHQPKLWAKIIEAGYKSANIEKIIKSEQQGAKQIKQGTYKLR